MLPSAPGEPRPRSTSLPGIATRLLVAVVAAALGAVALAGDVGGARAPQPTAEVVVTLNGPALSAFGRNLQSASHLGYLRLLDAAQSTLARRIQSSLPAARIRWRYRLVADGLAVALPRSQVAALSRVPGVAKVWPNVRYHALRDTGGPEQIGADELWGSALQTAGEGMKIGIIDDGLDATHPYFNPTGLQYPAGFPKGLTRYTTPKVIVQRTFAPATPVSKYADVPFDPTESFHATHVAGIAAGVHGANANGTVISGVAPLAYLGNYKALTVPTPGFGLDGNSAEIAAAIEAAVADGMNVINLSLGEPEVDPARDLVVQAIEGAAAAGVVPVVAAGNDFSDFGFGSVSSPGSAPDAITVAAVDSNAVVAGFSSGGPTPVSLLAKPDVSAPGVNVVSSVPARQGTWGELSGTSMASPHVAGAAALLRERHPEWTVAQIKSALEQTGDPARTPSGAEASPMREGGGVIDLPRADVPLIFASPTSVSFGLLAPGATATQTVAITDAGGGAGDWAVAVPSGALTAPATVTAPGALTLTATAGRTVGDVSGFVVLTHGTDVRRIPFWFAVSAPKLAGEAKRTLTKAGTYTGTTVRGPSLVRTYRYPTGGDVTYAGPERAYRFDVTGRPANAGVVVLSGHATPHITFDGSEDHLAGYTGLPLDLNPYRDAYGSTIRAAAVVLPAAGAYDAVFDTRSAADAGAFTFRYWVNDVRPPTVRVTSTRDGITVRATDAGSGVDPASIVARLDGRHVAATFAHGVIRVAAKQGRHSLVLAVADYQESKNMEDVAKILPNTATLRTTVRVT